MHPVTCLCRSRGIFGVADGTRTRDTQDHNLVLYQLNYSHHRCFCSGNYLSPSPCFHKNGW